MSRALLARGKFFGLASVDIHNVNLKLALGMLGMREYRKVTSCFVCQASGKTLKWLASISCVILRRLESLLNLWSCKRRDRSIRQSHPFHRTVPRESSIDL